MDKAKFTSQWLSQSKTFKDELILHLKGSLQNEDLQQGKTSGFSQIKGGADTKIFSFQVTYRSGGKDHALSLIIRIFQEFHGEIPIKHEVELHQFLFDIGIQVPKPYFLAFNHDMNCWYFVMEKIEGKLLSHTLNQITEEELPALCHLYADLIYKIHNLEMTSDLIQFTNISNITNSRELLGYELDSSIKFVEKYELNEIRPLLKWLYKYSEQVAPIDVVPIHGDLNPLNTIIRPDHTMILLDWSNFRISDFRVDLAMAIISMNIECAFDVNELMIASYQEISKKAVMNIDYFTILANFPVIALMYAALADKTNKAISIGLTIFNFKPYVNTISNLVTRITGISLDTLNE